MFGHIVMSYQLCGMAVVADEKLKAIYEKAAADDDESRTKVLEENPEARFYDGKLHSMRFFIDTYLPNAHSIAETIATGNRSPLEVKFPV